jgi:D-alanine-D-alanine ligase
MSQINVAVLRGGPSSEYEVSLKTGQAVLKHMPEKYKPRDVVITKDGTWHVGGFPVTPEHALRHTDVVFNALHGKYGEDGRVQQILESFKIPYTGSPAFASSMSMNKGFAKSVFQTHNIKTPHFKIISFEDVANIHELAMELHGTFPMPAILKPIASGSSIGIQFAQTLHELEDALNDVALYSNTVLIEEFLDGREIMVGIVSHLRGEELYALLPAEISFNGTVFDHAAKLKGDYGHTHWLTIKDSEKEQAAMMAKKAFLELGLQQYASFDFIATPRRGLYLLEANSLPGLGEHAVFPKSLDAVGSSMPHFLDHVLNLALDLNL